MFKVKLKQKGKIDMLPTETLKSKRVFYYFEQLSAIPRGSGNMKGAAQFCEDFAKAHNLKYVRDNFDNVIIYKDGTKGYENSKAVILQGHLDMVCQKTADCDTDFEKDGIKLYADGDFIKAEKTTLGADNGIAVAMVLAILESTDISHPPIEAVFTVDEEIGMLGANALDMNLLRGRRMINLDSEEDGTVTVSCAGGSNFAVNIPTEFVKTIGTLVTVDINGLKGGHSGVEIDKNRVNANMIAGRLLNALKNHCDFEIVSIDGGDKSNAIPNRCVLKLCTDNSGVLYEKANDILCEIKAEITDRENDFSPIVSVGENAEYSVFSKEIKEKIIYTLLCVPNGITEMSAEINGLVQTSLNLGVLTTCENEIALEFALRSNKMSALRFLEERLATFFGMLELPYNIYGQYPAWEFNENSVLKDIYCKVYFEMFEKMPKVEAIHAGLECGVFADALSGIDCIAIGPALYDVHTVNEKLSISSTKNLFDLILKMLKNLK